MNENYTVFVTQLIDDREWLEADNAEKSRLLGLGYASVYHQLMIYEGRPYLVAVLEKTVKSAKELNSEQI